MKLSSLEQLGSFALLGPGFSAGRFTLLDGLRAAAASTTGPRLVFAPYERAGRKAQVLSAEESSEPELELDVPPAELKGVLDEAGFGDKVERIRAAIAAGDVYQVCYTTRAAVAAPGGAALFAALCARGVPRFAAWVRLPGGAAEFVSASPELFFETRGRRVHSEPMKGTARPLSAAALDASEKDRAELAMITDLVRNDLTPVCRPRSVRVTCPRRTLELPYAVQTVSDVEGELRDGVTPLEVLEALHPGGSVTGAPKQAALAMIRELETSPRGAYCGALGLWGGERSVFSLLIRTATRAADGWTYGVGSGIVFDSVARQELDELRTKLEALSCATR
jgi:anthranilate/para-aminobenzoate synthase component I